MRAPVVQTPATEKVLAELDTSPRGLASADAAARRDRFGPNELPPARRRDCGETSSASSPTASPSCCSSHRVLLVASAITFLAYGLIPELLESIGEIEDVVEVVDHLSGNTV